MTIGSIRIDRLALAAALLLTALYAVVGLKVLDPEALFSIDAGVKYVQAKALRDSGFTSTAIPYPGEGIDPDHQFIPFSPPFVLERDGKLQGIFPLVGTFLFATVLPGGFTAFVLVSVAAACAVMLTVGAMGRPHAAAAVVVLGTCTWFWAYGVLMWEHLPALALSTASWALVTAGDRQRPGLAGVLLGVACCLRPESLLLAPGLAILTRTGAGWRAVIAFAAGVAGPLVVVAAADGFVYHRAPWVHVMHAVDSVWRGAGAADIIARPTPTSWATQAATVVGYWVVGLPGLAPGLAVIVLLFAANLRRNPLRDAALLAVLMAALMLAGRDVLVAWRTPDPLAGLLRASPFLLFAALPTATGAASRTRRLDQLVVAIFMAGLLATGDYGGAQIGPRLLTPVLPLLVTLAVESFASYWTNDRRNALASMVRVLGGALVAGSLAMQILANFTSVLLINREATDVLSFIRTSRPQASVMVEGFLFNHVAPEYHHHMALRATTVAEQATLSARLVKNGASRVVTIGRPTAPPIALTGFVPDGHLTTPHVTAIVWLRNPGPVPNFSR